MQRGIRYSGYPHIRKGPRYRLYLRKASASSQTYRTAGFELGVTAYQSQSRDAFSRNRTDGSNGEGEGAELYWDPAFFPIPYYISGRSFKNHPEFVGAIDDAFRTWRASENTELEFIGMGCTDITNVENDGINSVIFLESNWPFDPDAIAINRAFYIAGDEQRAGAILDADILLNGENHEFSSTNAPGAHDVQNIVTHEVGHFVGLGHEVAPMNPNSAMFPFASPNEFLKRDLSPDDEEGLVAIYSGTGIKFPEVRAEATCAIPTATMSCASAQRTCAASGRAGGGLSFLLVLVLWLGSTCVLGRRYLSASIRAW